MTKAEYLWEKLIDMLDRDGLLAQQSLRATPAEIAQHIRARTGDSRIDRFVWAYYYPRTFGNELGALSDLDAEALVESYNRRLTKQEKQAMEREKAPIPSVVIAPQDACRICGTRPIGMEGLK